MVVYSLSAQRKMTTLQYINKYRSTAIKKQKRYNIPASITLAQGILESGSGNSSLARKANNHFGIKCHKDWDGKKYYFDDDKKHECFRKYKNADESYRDHSKFLTQKGRYSFLFDYSTTDYKKWAYGLKKAGYATNPKYPQLLIKIIEKYNLDKLDRHNKSGRHKASFGKKSTYTPLSVVGFRPVGTSPSGREIFKNNGKKLIIVKKGDTFNALANEFEIYNWQFKSYNEIEKKHVLKPGEIIYIEKKRRNADKRYKYHVVVAGETMHDIAQLYGVRLKRLYNINNLPDGVQVEVGKRVMLR